MAHDIEQNDEELPDPALPEDASRGAVVGSAVLATYLVTAYRWGCTNEHAYHVFAGIDRTKALALARAEQSDRGGKYATVVWEFDADGTDYRSIAYFHSSACDEAAVVPHHNHRIDFYERVGMFVNEAMSGKALMSDPTNPKAMTYQEVTPLPDYVRAEVERQRAFMKIWERTENAATEGKKGGSS